MLTYKANFFAGLNLLGVGTEFDPNDGSSAGAAFIPTDLDPNNQTRSDARRTYYDPYVSRPNFHVITGQQVTRINIAGVAGNGASTSPTTGGNINGEGMAAGLDGSGLFGNDSTVPPPREQNGVIARFVAARDVPAGLRITGVEVQVHQRSDCEEYDKLMMTVCCQRICSAPECVYNTRGHRERWSYPLASITPAIGNWAEFATRNIWYSSGP